MEDHLEALEKLKDPFNSGFNRLVDQLRLFTAVIQGRSKNCYKPDPEIEESKSLDIEEDSDLSPIKEAKEIEEDNVFDEMPQPISVGDINSQSNDEFTMIIEKDKVFEEMPNPYEINENMDGEALDEDVVADPNYKSETNEAKLVSIEVQVAEWFFNIPTYGVQLTYIIVQNTLSTMNITSRQSISMMWFLSVEENGEDDKAIGDDHIECKDVIYLFSNAMMFLFDPGGRLYTLILWREGTHFSPNWDNLLDCSDNWNLNINVFIRNTFKGYLREGSENGLVGVQYHSRILLCKVMAVLANFKSNYYLSLSMAYLVCYSSRSDFVHACFFELHSMKGLEPWSFINCGNLNMDMYHNTRKGFSILVALLLSSILVLIEQLPYTNYMKIELCMIPNLDDDIDTKIVGIYWILDTLVSDPIMEAHVDMFFFLIGIPFAKGHFNLQATKVYSLQYWLSSVIWELGLTNPLRFKYDYNSYLDTFDNDHESITYMVKYLEMVVMPAIASFISPEFPNSLLKIDQSLSIKVSRLGMNGLDGVQEANHLMDELKKKLQSKELKFPRSELNQFVDYLLRTLQQDAMPLFNILRHGCNFDMSEGDPRFQELLDDFFCQDCWFIGVEDALYPYDEITKECLGINKTGTRSEDPDENDTYYWLKLPSSEFSFVLSVKRQDQEMLSVMKMVAIIRDYAKDKIKVTDLQAKLIQAKLVEQVEVDMARRLVLKVLLIFLQAKEREMIKATNYGCTITTMLVGLLNDDKTVITNLLHHIGRISAVEKGKLKHTILNLETVDGLESTSLVHNNGDRGGLVMAFSQILKIRLDKHAHLTDVLATMVKCTMVSLYVAAVNLEHFVWDPGDGMRNFPILVDKDVFKGGEM